MANDTSRNPIFLDTFSADFNLFTTGPVRIKAIVFRSATASDRFTLEASDGVNVFDLTTAENSQVILSFGDEGFPISRALTCDVSDGQYAATARAYIYLA